MESSQEHNAVPDFIFSPSNEILANVITLFIQRSSFTVPLNRNKHPLRSPIRNLVPCAWHNPDQIRNPEHPTRQVLDHLRVHSELQETQPHSGRTHAFQPTPTWEEPSSTQQEPRPTQEDPLKNPNLDQNTTPFIARGQLHTYLCIHICQMVS